MIAVVTPELWQTILTILGAGFGVKLVEGLVSLAKGRVSRQRSMVDELAAVRDEVKARDAELRARGEEIKDLERDVRILREGLSEHRQAMLSTECFTRANMPLWPN